MEVAYGKVANYIFHNFYLCNIAMTYQKQENNEMEEDDENEGEDEEEEDDIWVWPFDSQGKLVFVI